MKLKSDRFHLENVIAKMSCLHTVYLCSCSRLRDYYFRFLLIDFSYNMRQVLVYEKFVISTILYIYYFSIILYISHKYQKPQQPAHKELSRMHTLYVGFVLVVHRSTTILYYRRK